MGMGLHATCSVPLSQYQVTISQGSAAQTDAAGKGQTGFKLRAPGPECGCLSWLPALGGALHSPPVVDFLGANTSLVAFCQGPNAVQKTSPQKADDQCYLP